ncbi:hypothetical protein [Pedobacter kyonggii]|uniref:Uncharacterized protein n=1 Tax=Pedobacter kyonggii TaxID=1926871 RepID=A0A4Q9HGD7_9SPHI|nr:hypothetical protein [Pedobacter kyonggii]TBO44312.1 hypothetical protein EYS08_03085 [Pedobacter kyonggii]
MKLILTLIFSVFFSVCFGQKQGNNSRIIRDSAEIADLKKQVALLQTGIEQSNNIVAIGASTVANQLSASNTAIAVFGIVVAVMLFISGFYITKIESRTSALEKRTAEKLLAIEAIERRIVEIQSDIQNHTPALYKEIKREETALVLERIEQNPMTGEYLVGALYATYLNDSDYQRVYKLIKEGSEGDTVFMYVELLTVFLFKSSPITFLKGDTIFYPDYADADDVNAFIELTLRNVDKPECPIARGYLIGLLGRYNVVEYIDRIIGILTVDEIKQILERIRQGTMPNRFVDKLSAALPQE